MSAPYVSFTYFWNWLTISAVAEYVQLPTLTVPSAATAALTSASVMSLPIAAPPPAAGEAVLLHALATTRTATASAPIVRNLLRATRSSIRRTLLPRRGCGAPATPHPRPRDARRR